MNSAGNRLGVYIAMLALLACLVPARAHNARVTPQVSGDNSRTNQQGRLESSPTADQQKKATAPISN